MNLIAMITLLLLGTVCTVCQSATVGDATVAEAHNEKRRKESATNMKLLSWDPFMAAEAADYADQCDFSHADGVEDGENLYVTSGTFSFSRFQNAIDSWYNEKKDYDFSTRICNETKQCGHYTAIVWANTEKVGCAANHCPDGLKNIPWPSGTIVVCRYSPPGNFRSQHPYEKGSACSNCASGWKGCINGLCTQADSLATTSPAASSTTSKTSASPPTGQTTPTTRTVTTSTHRQSTSSTVPSSTTSKISATPPTGQSTAATSTGHTVTTSTHQQSTGSDTTQSPRGSCTTEYLDAMNEYRQNVAEWKQALQHYKQQYEAQDNP